MVTSEVFAVPLRSFVKDTIPDQPTCQSYRSALMVFEDVRSALIVFEDVRSALMVFENVRSALMVFEDDIGADTNRKGSF